MSSSLVLARSVKIYLASPFFNDEQRERLNRVRNFLEKLNFKVWDAMHDGVVASPNSSESERNRAFISNLKAMRDCDVCVGITDGKDMGTVWEMGYCYALGKKVVGYAETLGNKPFNLMLAQACIGVAKNLEELERILKGESIKYEGEIE